ncbi:MAG: 50S ribosomal protein L18 [Nanoarchaeota archaeon]
MKIQKKRRLQNKTDYGRRLGLLKGNVPRVVFRKTNKYAIAQYVTSNETNDKIEFGVTSKQLLKYGWPKESQGSLKSIPASYLTGFLMGKKIINGKKENPIADFGMIRNVHGTKIYAFLKGLADAGIKIKCDKKNFPSEDRITGKHLKKEFSKIFETIKSNIGKEK